MQAVELPPVLVASRPLAADTDHGMVYYHGMQAHGLYTLWRLSSDCAVQSPCCSVPNPKPAAAACSSLQLTHTHKLN